MFAIEVEAGDLIRVPKGTHHWFDLCVDRRIRAIRLFQDMSGWTPHYTQSGADSKFQPVWEPRFILYPDVGDLPRVAVAYLEAEAFISYPRLAFWRGRDRRAAGTVVT